MPRLKCPMRMNRLFERIINFLYRTATGTKRERELFTPVFALAFFCVVVLLIFISFYVDFLLGLPEFIKKPLSIALALPFLTGGSLLWLWCAGKFFKTKGTPVPVNPPPRLVTDGPYAYSRNPMMTGLFLVMIGTGIFAGSVTLTFIMTPLFVLMSVLEFKYIEEPELAKRFGKAYTEYREKTPVIIPRICRK
jgi:protein-S-isoprenylcysteine O-methyltransferase Ste14